MKKIALLNQKGGVGKTTTSVNLAVGLADKGFRVLLVDLDPQANTTLKFFQETDGLKTIADCFIDTNVDGAVYDTKVDNLSIICSSLNFSNIEMELRNSTTIPQHNRLKKILNKLEDSYDFCIIDCPPTINLITVNVILCEPLIIVPIKPSRDTLSGFMNTLENVYNVNVGFEINTQWMILFTMVNNNNTDKSFIKIFEETRKASIYDTKIRYQAKPIEEAGNNQDFIIRRKSNISNDYNLFLEELLIKL